MSSYTRAKATRRHPDVYSYRTTTGRDRHDQTPVEDTLIKGAEDKTDLPHDD